jgi:hypothetical protein
MEPDKLTCRGKPLELDEYGIPIGGHRKRNRSMTIVLDEDKRNPPSRVKDHPQWSGEPKPWGEPKYPGKGSCHNSIERHYLYRKGLQHGGNVVNLGVFRGVSTHSLAHGVKDAGGGKVYAVDFFKGAAFTVKEITDIFEEQKMLSYVQFCEGHTQDWAKKLSDMRFNFIFIDADHQYESAKRDFETWSPLLAPGGELAFHDVALNTVHKVITEELLDWTLVEHVWNIKTFRRTEEK